MVKIVATVDTCLVSKSFAYSYLLTYLNFNFTSILCEVSKYSNCSFAPLVIHNTGCLILKRAKVNGSEV